MSRYEVHALYAMAGLSAPELIEAAFVAVRIPASTESLHILVTICTGIDRSGFRRRSDPGKY
jgi:hypothetical protein